MQKASCRLTLYVCEFNLVNFVASVKRTLPPSDLFEAMAAVAMVDSRDEVTLM